MSYMLIGAKDRRERAGPDLRAEKSLRATTKPNGVIKSKAKTKYKSLGSTQRDPSQSQINIKDCFDRMKGVKSSEMLVRDLRAKRRGLIEGSFEEKFIPVGTKIKKTEEYKFRDPVPVDNVIIADKHTTEEDDKSR